VHEEEGKVNFYSYDPKNKPVQKLRRKNRGYLKIEAKHTGVYEFHLESIKVSK
jgi:hypothetical protein